MQPIPSLPYLTKAAGGTKFEIGAFMAMVAMIAVVGMWLWSASPALGTMGRWLGFGKKAQASMEPTLTPMPAMGFPVTTGNTTPYPVQVNVSITQQVLPTYTPYPTYTPFPTYTPYPEYVTPTPVYIIGDLGVPDPGVTAWEPVTLVLSYYWPPLCIGIEHDDPNAVNCDWYQDASGKWVPDIDHVSTGEHWAGYVGKWIACPKVWPIGSLVKIDGLIFRCSDGGGAIVQNEDGSYWVDLLYPYLPDGWWYGRRVDAYLWKVE